jgi:integrase
MTLYRRGKYYWVKLTETEKVTLQKDKIRFSTKLKNKKLAEIFLKELQEQFVIKKNKAGISKHPIGNLLFSEVLERYIEHKRNLGEALTDKTIEVYEKALKHFNRSLPNKLVTEYTKEDYNKFISEIKFSQNTKAIYSVRINTLFNFLVKEEYIQRNYFRTVREEVKEIKLLKDQEIKELLDYAKTTKFYDVVMLMHLGAFRASEAISINESNIKSEHIELIGKGNKKASIPIIEEMEEFLLTDPDLNNKITYPAIRQFFDRASKKLKFKVKSHDLRKHQLSRLANKGAKTLTLMNYARHSDVKTTLKYYAKMDLNEMKNEIDRILK